MNDIKKNELNPISDKKLEDIVGGAHVTDGSYIKDAMPTLETDNHSSYKSGDTPKYSIGQKLKIKFRYKGESSFLSCTVLDVSKTKDCGTICKEYGYKIQLHENNNPYTKLLQETYDNVYESCLYDF